MPSEKTNEVAEKANVEVTEPKAETPDIDWKAEAERLRTEQETLEKSYKASRNNVNDLQSKLRQAQAQASNLEALIKKVEGLEENQAITLDYVDALRTNQDLEPETQQSKPHRLDELKIKRAEDQRMQELTNSFYLAVNEAGLDPNDPEFRSEVMMNSQSPVDALRKLPAFVSKRIRKEAEERQKQEAEDKKVTSVQEIQDSGALAIDKTSPTSNYKEFTTAQISDRAFWEEHKTEILAAQKEGRIKE